MYCVDLAKQIGTSKKLSKNVNTKRWFFLNILKIDLRTKFYIEVGYLLLTNLLVADFVRHRIKKEILFPTVYTRA